MVKKASAISGLTARKNKSVRQRDSGLTIAGMSAWISRCDGHGRSSGSRPLHVREQGLTAARHVRCRASRLIDRGTTGNDDGGTGGPPFSFFRKTKRTNPAATKLGEATYRGEGASRKQKTTSGELSCNINGLEKQAP